MSSDATLPIGKRFADVRSTPHRVPALGRRGILDGSTLLEKGTAVGTELRSLEEGAEGARDE